MKIFLSILLLCCHLFAKAQPPEVYRTQPAGGSCPATVFLHANGDYAFAFGCETAPHLSFGTWTKKGDTIKLAPVNPATYTVIKNSEATRMTGDSIWLTVLDKGGVNMTAKISAGLEVSGRGSYMMSNDSSGTRKFVHQRDGGKLVLRTLSKLFGRRIELATDTANHFVVTVNLSASWISSTHADWGGSGPFFLLKKGDVLYSSFPKQSFVKEPAFAGQ